MFIANHPAMRIGSYLVVSDMHLGITYELWKHGVSLPSQAGKFAERLNRLKKLSGAKNLVMLGDIKHKVPGISAQEMRELPLLLSLLRFEKIIILKGNHDGNIETLIPERLKKKVVVKNFFSYKKYLLFHGHQNPESGRKAEIYVIGHSQPAIKFRDASGAIYVERAWIRGWLKGGHDAWTGGRLRRPVSRSRKVIIMPAFNELSGSTIANEHQLLGPVAKRLDFSRSHAYLLDGTDLGALNDLKLKNKKKGR